MILFKVGDRVVIKNLLKASHLNGKIGLIVEGFNNENGRYTLGLDSTEFPEIQIKPNNLEAYKPYDSAGNNGSSSHDAENLHDDAGEKPIIDDSSKNQIRTSGCIPSGEGEDGDLFIAVRPRLHRDDSTPGPGVVDKPKVRENKATDIEVAVSRRENIDVSQEQPPHRLEAEKEWACAICTFLNEPIHLNCTMCGQEKASTEQDGIPVETRTDANLNTKRSHQKEDPMLQQKANTERTTEEAENVASDTKLNVLKNEISQMKCIQTVSSNNPEEAAAMPPTHADTRSLDQPTDLDEQQTETGAVNETENEMTPAKKSSEDDTFIRPGAYGFKDGELQRNISGFISPQAEEEDSHSLQCSSLVGPDPAVVENELIIEAQVAPDDSEIEAQVRQRILEEAVRADVVIPDNVDQLVTTPMKVKKGGIGERLFGDSRCSADVDIAASPEKIRKRTLLPFSIFQNETTLMWVSSINTNQKALECNDQDEVSKSIRSFSSPTKQEAVAFANALTPPRMLSFSENGTCFVCRGKFAVFRKRPRHCRNCGVCVCAACSTAWPCKMIPETFNIKNESSVNVCKACDWLSTSFRKSLLNGQLEEAKKLYDTGNVNLRTRFGNMKGELMYPIHCAVIGGNLSLLKWLVDDYFCPLRSEKLRAADKTKDCPLLTSKGRSVLGIALTGRNIDIIRYLVADKRMSIFEEKDLNSATTILNFTAVLELLRPEDCPGCGPGGSAISTDDARSESVSVAASCS